MTTNPKTFLKRLTERGLPYRVIWTAQTDHPTFPEARCIKIGRCCVIVSDHVEGGYDLAYMDGTMHSAEDDLAEIEKRARISEA